MRASLVTGEVPVSYYSRQEALSLCPRESIRKREHAALTPSAARFSALIFSYYSRSAV